LKPYCPNEYYYIIDLKEGLLLAWTDEANGSTDQQQVDSKGDEALVRQWAYPCKGQKQGGGENCRKYQQSPDKGMHLGVERRECAGDDEGDDKGSAKQSDKDIGFPQRQEAVHCPGGCAMTQLAHPLRSYLF